MLDLEFGKKISRPWIWHSNILSENKKNKNFRKTPQGPFNRQGVGGCALFSFEISGDEGYQEVIVKQRKKKNWYVFSL